MAFRALVARRSSLVSSDIRTMLQSGRLQQRPNMSTQPEYTGNALNDAEKAAENRYFKKLEAERKLTAEVAAAGHAGAAATGTPTPGVAPSSSPLKSDGSAEGGFRNTAVVGGLIALVAGYWLYSSSGSKKQEEKESS
jgi:hypothetical protein